MDPSHQANCVAIFESHEEVEAAIRELHASGFDMKDLSIVGRDYHTEENPVGFYNAGDRVRHWGKLGAFWGVIFGVLLAPAFFWIPGIGPILTGGFLGSALMGTIEGGMAGAVMGGGLSALAATLVGLGIPKDSVIRYERALKAENYLLIATGSAEDVEDARKLLSTRAASTDVHS
jgi:uncharacterized membrane protein